MTAQAPSPAGSAIEQFLRETVRDNIQLAAIGSKGPPICKWFGEDVQGATAWAVFQNRKGRGVYWTVNCATPHLNRKPSKGDILCARYGHVDIDPPFDREQILKSLRDAKCPPSFIVASGNGLQAFWRLAQETPDLELVEELNRRVCAAFDGDKGTHNIDRLMRLPGTVNFPNDKKRAAGRVAVLAAVIGKDEGANVSMADLAAGFQASPQPIRPKQLVAGSPCFRPTTLSDLKIVPESRLYGLITAPPCEDRSVAVFACASEMIQTGFCDDQIGGILINTSYAISAHCLEQPNPGRAIARVIVAARRRLLEDRDNEGSGVSLEDFYAYMPSHQYFFTPSGEFWPAASVNARLPRAQLLANDGTPVSDANGDPKFINASTWLDKERPVEQMVWAPGLPKLITDRLVSGGGWIERPGASCLNHYLPPSVEEGDSAEAGKWIDHVRRLYPEEADHIISWLAHRIQHPEDKINHALVLGGSQGIGKDTLLEPIKYGVGHANFTEVSPAHMLGQFNGYLKSVILRISEARDLGDADRFKFYDHMKTITAAPPDVLRVNEKHLREYSVFNVCGVIITTNHKTDGIFLSPDDRRHFVAWSPLTKEDFTEEYWSETYAWFGRGGSRHVVAYLRALDLAGFNAKGPPPKTEAFRAIVDAGRAPEDAELTDVLEKLDFPRAVTLSMLRWHADGGFYAWLQDRKYARAVPHRLESCGYERVSNPQTKDGMWKLPDGRVNIYCRSELSLADRIGSAQDLVANPPEDAAEPGADLSAA